MGKYIQKSKRTRLKAQEVFAPKNNRAFSYEDLEECAEALDMRLAYLYRSTLLVPGAIGAHNLFVKKFLFKRHPIASVFIEKQVDVEKGKVVREYDHKIVVFVGDPKYRDKIDQCVKCWNEHGYPAKVQFSV